jgi:hypothetical protein
VKNENRQNLDLFTLSSIATCIQHFVSVFMLFHRFNITFREYRNFDETWGGVRLFGGKMKVAGSNWKMDGATQFLVLIPNLVLVSAKALSVVTKNAQQW